GKIRAVVYSGQKDRRLLVGAYCRGRAIDQSFVNARKGEKAETHLATAGGPGGVYRVTVFEERPAGDRVDLVPVAERLLYRVGTERLKVTVTPAKKKYVPGDRVKLSVAAKDEKGKAAPAVVLVSVVDKSVLTLADEKTARAMPTHFLLT